MRAAPGSPHCRWNWPWSRRWRSRLQMSETAEPQPPRRQPGSLQHRPASGWSQGPPTTLHLGPRTGDSLDLPVQPPQPGEASSAAESGLTLKLVTDHWPQVLALMQPAAPQRAQDPGAAQFGRHFGHQGRRAVFRPARGAEVQAGEERDARAGPTRCSSRCLGSMYPCAAWSSTGKTGSLPPDVDSDGMVATALRDLGGEIVDIQ